VGQVGNLSYRVIFRIEANCRRIPQQFLNIVYLPLDRIPIQVNLAGFGSFQSVFGSLDTVKYRSVETNLIDVSKKEDI
jgi:hypothetical protein